MVSVSVGTRAAVPSRGARAARVLRLLFRGSLILAHFVRMAFPVSNHPRSSASASLPIYLPVFPASAANRKYIRDLRASAISRMLVAASDEHEMLDACYCWLRFEKRTSAFLVRFWTVVMFIEWQTRCTHLYANKNTQLC